MSSLDSFSTPSPPSHLPGRLSSVEDLHQALPALLKVNNLVTRLKVQAFVLLIHEMFCTLPDLKTLSILRNEDSPSSLCFGGFEGKEEYREDFERMDKIAHQLDLPCDSYLMFDTHQPFDRDGLRDQLASAYNGALTNDQRRQGGQWEPFWSSLPTIPDFVDEDTPDMEEDGGNDHFHGQY